MKTAFNIILGVLGITALILSIMALRRASQPATIQPDGSTSPKGFGAAFASVISDVTSSQWWKNLLGGKEPPFGLPQCDPNRKGYTIDGVRDTRCEVVTPGDLGCTGACDPNRPGWDDCGLPDNNCY